MKFGALVLLGICSCLCFPSFEPTSGDQHFPCTFIALPCPGYTLPGNGPIRVAADVVGAERILGEKRAKLLTYTWEISGGRIIEGAGSSSVLIEPIVKSVPATPADLTVSLTVGGVDPTCENQKSCLMKIDPQCSQPAPFDQYGVLSFRDEKLVLDRVAAELSKTARESQIYIVAYAGASACISEGEWKANRAKRYLTHQHKIEANHIKAVDGGFRQYPVTELFILPAGSCGPFPTPTLKQSNAHITGLCSDGPQRD